VSEPRNRTKYQYDANGNLLSAVQSGSRQRTFVYDSLSRLTQSNNPESGAVSYTYDADGNVLTKTDARGVTISYSYDVLNRLRGKTYSNGDPPVTYAYDQAACLGRPACYNLGRRTTMTDAAGSEQFSYDQMGRIPTEQRTTGGITKPTSIAFNFDGSVKTLTYPSGTAITYAVDSAGRPFSAIDQSSKTYANGATYAPQGALAGLTLGTTVNLSNTYNNRLQPNEIKAFSAGSTVMDLTYGFVDANGNNNGSVTQIINNVDGTRSQTFAYDALNRIITGETASTYAASPAHCWGESYQYDNQTTGGAWGNLTNINVASSAYNGCTQETLNVSATPQNQLSATGFSYDLAGNMLSDSANGYIWNAESELKSAAGVTYTYDGDGNRLQKSSGKIYWYGAGTEILDESDASGNFTNEYVFFGGKRIAMRNVSTGAIYYYAEDVLGTSRTMFQDGQTSPCFEADFYPFGGERDIISTCAPVYKFESKERDTETGNDDFGARYYTSRLGRWLSADWSSVPAPVPYANLTNPQTLNLYAIVSDNPETFADLDGHDDTAVAEPETETATATESAEGAVGAGAEGAEEGAEIGETGGPEGAAIGAAVGIAVGVGTYEYEKHYSKPGAPPTPPAPKPPDFALAPTPQGDAEHKKGARPSTEQKHEGGQTRKKRDAREGEKGDRRREEKGMFPRKRPKGHKGPWPPKTTPPPPPPPPPSPPPPEERPPGDEER
jgi:RHS repeat-associated protein